MLGCHAWVKDLEIKKQVLEEQALNDSAHNTNMLILLS